MTRRFREEDIVPWDTPLSQAFLMAALSKRFDFLAGEVGTDSATYVRIGEFVLDMSLYTTPLQGLATRTVKFVVDLDIVGTCTADVKLFDQTHGVDVTGTNLTHNTTTNAEKSSAALTVGSANGNIRNDVVTNYCAYLKMVGGVAGVDRAFCTNARLTIDYAP